MRLRKSEGVDGTFCLVVVSEPWAVQNRKKSIVMTVRTQHTGEIYCSGSDAISFQLNSSEFSISLNSSEFSTS